MEEGVFLSPISILCFCFLEALWSICQLASRTAYNWFNYFRTFFSVTFLHTEEIGFIKSPFKSIDTTVQLDDLIRVRLN